MFRLKGRSSAQALPLLLADTEELGRWAVLIPDSAWRLAHGFWPGPLTVVLRRSRLVSDLVTGGRDTVALRVPDHEVPRSVSRLLGLPLTGTSANRSGSPGLTTAGEVRRELSDEVDLVVDGACGPDGLPSTIVDLSGEAPRILREGAVPADAIEALCGSSVVQ